MSQRPPFDTHDTLQMASSQRGPSHAEGSGISTTASSPTPILPSDGSMSDLVRHKKFYMDSVTLLVSTFAANGSQLQLLTPEAVFQAGRTLFKVPIYALPKEDGVFSAMFDLPNARGEGSSDENPIRLPAEVTAEDFNSFLEACIPT